MAEDLDKKIKSWLYDYGVDNNWTPQLLLEAKTLIESLQQERLALQTIPKDYDVSNPNEYIQENFSGNVEMFIDPQAIINTLNTHVNMFWKLKQNWKLDAIRNEEREDIYRKALEFYADKFSWESFDDSTPVAICDEGELARTSLNEANKNAIK